MREFILTVIEHLSKNEASPKLEVDNENYEKWRDIQRNQLSTSSNIYLGFSSAALAFSLNFLLKNETIDCNSKFSLIVGCIFLILSIITYRIFTNHRLKDFRKTARLFSLGYSPEQVKRKTKEIGDLTWCLYRTQIWMLTLGCVFVIIGFSIVILQP